MTRPSLPSNRILIALSLCFVVLLSGCAAQRAYDDGQRLSRDGQHHAAAERYAEASRLSPDSAKYRLAAHFSREAATQTERDKAANALRDGKGDQAKETLTRSLSSPRTATEAADRLYAIQVNERQQAVLAQAKAAVSSKDWEKAKTLIRKIQIEDPANAEVLLLQQELEQIEADKRGNSRQTLNQSYRKPISIEFKDTPLKAVFEVISRSSGINFLFDKDIKLDQKTSIFLRNSSIEAAVKLTLLTNQLEQQVLDANTVLIHPSTQAKMREYQPLKVRVFYLANAEAKTVAATLKAILKTKDLVADDKLNMLVMRDTPEAIELAEKLIAAHDVSEPEVMLEVEILEVNRKRLLELGVRWPEQLGLTPLGANESGLTLAELWSAIGDSSKVGATVGATTINARKVDSDGEVLANPRIRVRNRQKAKILIGDRVPNITSTANATGFVAESINYVDVGLKLDVEPVVYVDREVAITVSLEVSNLVEQIKTQAGSIAYRIGTRSAQTVLRLKDGENQVLAGLISNEDRTSSNKIPGLGELPVAGRLFGSQLDNENKTEIILSITPRIVRNIRKPASSILEYESGTEAVLGQYMPTSISAGTGQPSPAKAGAEPDARKPADLPSAEPKETKPPLGVSVRWLGPSSVKKGDTVAVQLLIDSQEPIASLPVSIGFDPKAFQILTVTEGDFLIRSGGKSNFAHRIEPAGQILMTGTLANNAGSQGTGVFATLNLRALATSPPNTNLRITALAPVGLNGSSVSVVTPVSLDIAMEP